MAGRIIYVKLLVKRNTSDRMHQQEMVHIVKKATAKVVRGPRRQHELRFQAELVKQCMGPGASLVADVCLGTVSAATAREVSRFARNSREWQRSDRR